MHVSEISHQRVGHPQEVLEVGQQGSSRGLAHQRLGPAAQGADFAFDSRRLEKDPWQEIKDQFAVGTVVTGKVDGLEDFGAFVELAEGVRGLVARPRRSPTAASATRGEVLSIGDEVKVVVLEVDVRRQRLRLSICPSRCPRIRGSSRRVSPAAAAGAGSRAGQQRHDRRAPARQSNRLRWGWPTAIFNPPTRPGYYGEYGGAFIPEILRTTLDELTQVFEDARRDPAFWAEFRAGNADVLLPPAGPQLPFSKTSLARSVGRGSSSSARISTTRVPTKVNNVMGQGLLVRRMGKSRVIAETGAGQHGVATSDDGRPLGAGMHHLHGGRRWSNASGPMCSGWSN